MAYSLYPSEALRLLRVEFDQYEVCELHDHDGSPYLSAVLKPQYATGSLPVLVTAQSVEELRTRLRDAVLTARLCAAVRALDDRGLLPEWRPPDDSPSRP